LNSKKGRTPKRSELVGRGDCGRPENTGVGKGEKGKIGMVTLGKMDINLNDNEERLYFFSKYLLCK
jgi:hypothetical protein